MIRFRKIARISLFAAAAWVSLYCPGINQDALQAQAVMPAASVTAKDFVGTWNWIYKDRHFATTILKLDGERLSGTMTHSQIEMDNDGNITRAVAAKGQSPILHAWPQNGVLHIVSKDGQDTVEMAMILTSPTTAELRFTGQGAPAHGKSIRLEKVWSEPPVLK